MIPGDRVTWRSTNGDRHEGKLLLLFNAPMRKRGQRLGGYCSRERFYNTLWANVVFQGRTGKTHTARIRADKLRKVEQNDTMSNCGEVDPD
jgi:hypothetical protein